MRIRNLSWNAKLITCGMISVATALAVTGCGTTASTSTPNKIPATSQNNTTSNGGSVPQIVVTDVNALWADYTQLMQDATTSNLSLMSHDITTAKSDYSTAETDYKDSPKSQSLTNSGFSDFLARYNQFLATISKAVADAKNGNLSDEQVQLADATKQQSYLQAEYETITGP